ncbi:MAG: bifunctional aspartate kinase/homoserine dehydrogenase I [Ferruginibacter sp.]
MQVLKFGGSSVANADNIKKVIAIVKEKIKHDTTVVVVSALGGVTDLLLDSGAEAAAGNESYKDKLAEIESRHMEAVRALIPITGQSSILSFVKTQCNEMEDICNGIFLLREVSPRTKDRMASYGELLSSRIIATALQSESVATHWIDSAQVIKTNADYGNAAVNFAITNANISLYVQENPCGLYLAPGFIASSEENIHTTLGRGGSDYSAAIYAGALKADRLEIWTDVSGMMTADPRLVKHARIIDSISYQEAMELSHFGAKVIYPPTIQPVMIKGIPVWIKNTFAPDDKGTLIQDRSTAAESSVTGISSINHIALLSLEGSGMIGIPGFSKRLFAALATQKINVILITQSSSEHSICVGIDEKNVLVAKKVIDEEFSYEIGLKKLDPLKTEVNLSVIALVGDRMKNHSGISGKFFSALGTNGVNIRAISQGSSERNITAVISSKDVRKAINVIHEAFFEKALKEVNLFIAGVGNVGSKLIAQLQQQQQYLQDQLNVKIKLVGIANSKKSYIDETGMDIHSWQNLLEDGLSGNIHDFIDKCIQLNLRNTVFADVTANEVVANVYDRLLKKTIAVVACNKIACSSSYEYYKKLKDTSKEFNARFLFETNVGASLPIIGTLNDLLRSGDKVTEMQAVLSGTLNFVFNNYDGTRSFAQVVKQAQDEGYTEPDPRLDLSGKDVMRKIMILAREAGHVIEMEDISNNSFMPEECMKGSVEDFYASMERHEPHFRKILDEAQAKNCKLKFVASFKDSKAAVGLQHIDPAHDLYHLYGKDNIVLFNTNRYVQQPLVVKGAGAGAELTASGVFADILRASRT